MNDSSAFAKLARAEKARFLVNPCSFGNASHVRDIRDIARDSRLEGNYFVKSVAFWPSQPFRFRRNRHRDIPIVFRIRETRETSPASRNVHVATCGVIRAGTSSLKREGWGRRGGGGGRWRKHGGRNWSRALLNTVSAQHDFFGADTRLGVCRMHARARARTRARTLSSSLRKIK